MSELIIRSEERSGDSPTTTAANNVVRWEKFLPKMSLRVLLVEADDSTRHIIAALLRKCSYKVAAISDGLKAWEVLKQKSHNIDLILTEVELPSISGFALLTLIMEHQVCKNIPVIMMSPNDSVSTVYKCMLRGAADFLVKPVRKNELNNLWQHVWRRQAVTNRHKQESDAQQKVEATAENNATSNPSSAYRACIKTNRECIEKGSDAQSSCTKPSSMEPTGQNNMPIDVRWEQTIVVSCNNSREAIDLIGSFDSYPKPSSINKVDHPSPLLDLSLRRRSHPSSSVNQFSDDRHRLKHSDVSAFSRYINRTQPPLTSASLSISNQQKDCETNSDKPLSMNPVEYISDTHSALVGSYQHNMINQQGQDENQIPSHKERVFPVPAPVRGATYGSVLPPPFFLEGNNTTQVHEDISSPTDHSGNSSFCNGSGSNGHVNLAIDGNNNIHRSVQREAALNKFRMKRKDRCFDKKVRYESRKKLAEQRPRVKGQFVRQGQTSNSSPMEVDTELATTKAIA